MEFLTDILPAGLHADVGPEQRVIDAAFERQTVREFLAHRESETERLVMFEGIIVVIVFQLGHRAGAAAYRSVGHHHAGAGPADTVPPPVTLPAAKSDTEVRLRDFGCSKAIWSP